jgi:Tol biopolymer transport system component
LKTDLVRRTAPYLFLLAAHLLALPEATAADDQKNELISANPDGDSGSGDSTTTDISADGRFLCFRSYASDLIEDDGNEFADIYVRDTLLQTIERVSVDSFGQETDASSYEPKLSADGRYVAFRSFATNLVSNDTNGAYDIFVHDRHTHQTERISVRTNGYEGGGASSAPTISADGRFVAYHSVANNLVTGDTNNQVDIFLRDRKRGATVRISLNASGQQANNRSHQPSISADGRYVAFYSYATNLVTGDTNGFADVFVRDNLQQTTHRVSISTTGVQATADCTNPAISADGRWVCFQSNASNLVNGDTNGVSDVFVHDRATGTTERVSIDSADLQADNASVHGRLSADGRFVVFQSAANNLIGADTNGSDDVFLRDRLTGITERVNLNNTNSESDGLAFEPSISADGRRLAFWASASDLVASDLNGKDDVFVRDRGVRSEQNIIVLTGPWRCQPGQTVALHWFAGPPNSQYALAASLSRSGTTFAGHRFEIGSPYQILTLGEHKLNGTGSFFTAPISANLSGRILYFEVAAIGAGNVMMDSIVHAVEVL